MQVLASLCVKCRYSQGWLCWALLLCPSVVAILGRVREIWKGNVGAVGEANGSCVVRVWYAWSLSARLCGLVLASVGGVASGMWHVWKLDCDFLLDRGWSCACTTWAENGHGVKQAVYQASWVTAASAIIHA